jgi:hypothetical protein
MQPSVDIPPSPCLGCGKVTDMAKNAFEGSRFPGAGDFTVCIYCGHIMVFNDDLTVRDPTGKEMIEMAGDQRIIAIQKAREDFHGRKKG